MRISETPANEVRVHPESPQKGFYSAQLTYHELADVPVKEADVIEQLESNLKQLAELQSRMKFMMREIRYLMKV